LSQLVQGLILNIRESYKNLYLPFQVVKQKDASEVKFINEFLVEEKVATDMSYVDFVCFIHQEIQKKIDE